MDNKRISELIRCPGCKTYNDEGSKYCLLCGAILHKQCGNCGTMSTDEFAVHCTECGTKLDAHGPEGK